MSLPVTFSNTTFPATYLGTDDGAPKGSFKVDNASTYSVTVNGTINKIGDTVTLTFGSDAPNGYAGTTATLTATQYDNTGQILFSSQTMPPNATDPSSTGWRYLLSNTQLHGKYLSDGVTPDPNRTTFTADNNDANLSDYQVSGAPCFTTGTLIRTERGNVSVEKLVAGDIVVTASGEDRKISWVGHRVVDCRNHRLPDAVLPIRIAAHAFGDNRPARDLFVSPGHSICVDVLGEVLIPASALLNGSTVQQIEVDEVTYWHVELDSHDVILAENLPAESYLDMGNRGFFKEAGVVDLAVGPDADPARRTHADFCRPFVDGGPVLDAVKAQLRRRAESLGWAQSDALEMHLVVDGRRLDPVVRGLTARFEVPAEAKDVWLEAPTARPCDVTGSCDGRDLGLFIKALRIDDGFEVRDIAIDDPLLCIGFHPLEEGSRRWTTGRARLPAAFWEGCGNGFNLRVELAGTPIPRWTRVAARASASRGPAIALVA